MSWDVSERGWVTLGAGLEPVEGALAPVQACRDRLSVVQPSGALWDQHWWMQCCPKRSFMRWHLQLVQDWGDGLKCAECRLLRSCGALVYGFQWANQCHLARPPWPISCVRTLIMFYNKWYAMSSLCSILKVPSHTIHLYSFSNCWGLQRWYVTYLQHLQPFQKSIDNWFVIARSLLQPRVKTYVFHCICQSWQGILF